MSGAKNFFLKTARTHRFRIDLRKSAQTCAMYTAPRACRDRLHSSLRATENRSSFASSWLQSRTRAIGFTNCDIARRARSGDGVLRVRRSGFSRARRSGGVAAWRKKIREDQFADLLDRAQPGTLVCNGTVDAGY
jgi:hypothetical protein